MKRTNAATHGDQCISRYRPALFSPACSWQALDCLAGGDGGRTPGLSRVANVKSIGWASYAAGFVIWLFGYLSTGHASAFDWGVATPRWISSFVPNLEAELGLALMFASMIPIYWRAGRKRAASSQIRRRADDGVATRKSPYRI
jgi:hypothetical protein